MERRVKLSFVTGFPDHISVRLQQLPDIDAMAVGDLVSKARVLTLYKPQDLAAVAKMGPDEMRWLLMSSDEPGGGQGQTQAFKGQCFRCRGPHMVKDCVVRIYTC